MVLLIIIPFLNGYFIGKINPTFSDKPTWLHGFWAGSEKVPLKRARKGDLVVPGELLPGATEASYVPAMFQLWMAIIS